MSKSAKLLHLDPFAAALTRKERESRENLEVSSLSSDAPATTAGGRNNATWEAISQKTGGQDNLLREDADFNTGGHSMTIAAPRQSGAGGNLPAHKSGAGGNLPAKKKYGKLQKESVGGQRKDRRPEDHKKLSLWFPRVKISEWKKFCEDAELTLTSFLDIAASRLMESAASQLEQNAGGNPPHDELMTNFWRTHDDIRLLYCDITGNKWKSEDDRAAATYNGLDRRILEIGILTTAIRFKGKKINSFKYFMDEIELTMDEIKESRMGDEALSAMLFSRRTWWQKKREGKL